MTPTNLLEWIALILFPIVTPMFFWFLYQDSKRRNSHEREPQ